MERELKDSITNVANAALEPLVRFLPLILDEMLKLITRPPMILNQTGVNSGHFLLSTQDLLCNALSALSYDSFKLTTTYMQIMQFKIQALTMPMKYFDSNI